MYDFHLEKINIKNYKSREEVRNFLSGFDLDYDQDVDYTIVVRSREKIEATCSKARNILKCFAVSEEFRGEGITAKLVTALIDKLFEEGYYHSFIFTKSANIDIFTSVGFKLIHSTEVVALLEHGFSDINSYLSELADKYELHGKLDRVAIVMNCNPFTTGHQFLIEEASRRFPEVLVFIVEEDRSLFPYRDRYRLVKEGTEYLGNVKVIPGGEYIISSATFPSYFLRKEDEKLNAYTELDAGIFGRYFCSAFNVKARFVGEEPYCEVTYSYNEALERILKAYGVELIKIERRKHNNYYISASIVRKLIKCGKLEETRSMLPEITWEYLNTDAGREVMERIISSNSPH